MPTSFAAAKHDPLVTVFGCHGTPYPCPDIAAVDNHLEGLRNRIVHAQSAFPGLIRAYRAEIDLLLERRMWLQTVRDAA